MTYRFVSRAMTAAAVATATATAVAAPASAAPQVTASSPSTGQLEGSIHNTMDWAVDCEVSASQAQLPNIPLAVFQDIQPGDTQVFGPLATPLKAGHAVVVFTFEARNGWSLRLSSEVDVP